MQQHFVTFLSPGTFVHEETTKPIDRWDSALAAKMAKDIKERHGATPFGFYFTTRRRKATDLDSKVTDRSKMFFLGGQILTLAEVKRRMPDKHILIANMEDNKIERVIINSNSWQIVQPFNPGDQVVTA